MPRCSPSMFVALLCFSGMDTSCRGVVVQPDGPAIEAFQHSVLDSAYENGSGRTVQARIELNGSTGRYIVSDRTSSFVGLLRDIQYRTDFRDQYNNAFAAITGVWNVGRKSGFFVFREPNSEGVLDGYWGETIDGSQQTVGSWDCRLVSYLNAPPVIAVGDAPKDNGAPAPNAPVLAGERIFGANDILKMTFLADGVRAGSGVGRVAFRTTYVSETAGGRPFDPQIGTSYGTAFLVGESLVLTAYHVVQPQDVVNALAVQFDEKDFEHGVSYEFDGQPLASSPTPTKLSDKTLDYALLRLKSKPTGVQPFVLKPHRCVKGQTIAIIHYPGGSTFRHVTLHSSKITRASADEPFVLYDSDTLQGSSGAPVLNRSWEVVAIHSSEVSSEDNLGCRIDAIVEDLRVQLRTQPHVLAELGLSPGG